MLHNKYACDNPVQVTNEGDLYTFTYLDCRQTSRQAIRSILNEYAYKYFCDEGLLSRVPGIYCGQIPFTFSGNSANILLIPGLGGGVTVPPPSGFSYTVPFNVTKTSGQYITDWNPESVIPTTSATYYVDVSTGSDSNPGTEELPFKSIYQAVHNRNADILVYVAPGVYEGQDGWRGALAGTNFNERNVVVRRWGPTGTIVSRRNLVGLSWSLYSGTTWQATVSGITSTRVIDRTQIDLNGNANVLQNQSSIASVESNPGSSHYAANTVYVHTHDGREPDSDIDVFASSTNGEFRGKTLWCEHITFEGGSFAFSANTFAAFEQRCYFSECKFLYSLQAAGSAQFDNGKEVVFFNCESSNNEGDGFKYLATTRQLNYVEINCEAYNNGYRATTNIVNGSSAHDGVVGVRVNGTYSGGRGRSIHDITSGQSWILGCVAGPSDSGTSIGSQSAFAAGTGIADTQEMWLDGCTSLSTEADVEAANDAVIRLRNFTRTAGVDAGSGTVTTY